MRHKVAVVLVMVVGLIRKHIWFALVVLSLVAMNGLGQHNVSGSGVDMRRGQTLLFAPVNASSSGDNTIVSADGTRKIKLLSYLVVAGGTVNVTWKSGAGTSLSGALPLVVNSGVASPIGSPGGGWLLETAVNQALVLNLSGAVQVSGHVSYFLEP